MPNAAAWACASASSWIPCPSRWPPPKPSAPTASSSYTEPYAAAWGTPEQAAQLQRYTAAAQAALAAGLGINAGHDLNRDNLSAFVAAVPGLLEVSIGHAFIADALELGYTDTVRAYQRCIDQGMQERKLLHP